MSNPEEFTPESFKKSLVDYYKAKFPKLTFFKNQSLSSLDNALVTSSRFRIEEIQDEELMNGSGTTGGRQPTMSAEEWIQIAKSRVYSLFDIPLHDPSHGLPLTLFLEGALGTGKSTLAKYLARRQALLLPGTQNENIFTLYFPLASIFDALNETVTNLADISQTASTLTRSFLIELFLEDYRYEQAKPHYIGGKQEEVLTLLMSSRILWIFDGLDELSGLGSRKDTTGVRWKDKLVKKLLDELSTSLQENPASHLDKENSPIPFWNRDDIVMFTSRPLEKKYGWHSSFADFQPSLKWRALKNVLHCTLNSWNLLGTKDYASQYFRAFFPDDDNVLSQSVSEAVHLLNQLGPQWRGRPLFCELACALVHKITIQPHPDDGPAALVDFGGNMGMSFTSSFVMVDSPEASKHILSVVSRIREKSSLSSLLEFAVKESFEMARLENGTDSFAKEADARLRAMDIAMKQRALNCPQGGVIVRLSIPKSFSAGSHVDFAVSRAWMQSCGGDPPTNLPRSDGTKKVLFSFSHRCIAEYFIARGIQKRLTEATSMRDIHEEVAFYGGRFGDDDNLALLLASEMLQVDSDTEGQSPSASTSSSPPTPSGRSGSESSATDKRKRNELAKQRLLAIVLDGTMRTYYNRVAHEFRQIVREDQRNASSKETRRFWQPNSESSSCMACQGTFGFSKRKHHCRMCGCLYCGDCCKNGQKSILLPMALTLSGGQNRPSGMPTSGSGGRRSSCSSTNASFSTPGGGDVDSDDEAEEQKLASLRICDNCEEILQSSISGDRWRHDDEFEIPFLNNAVCICRGLTRDWIHCFVVGRSKFSKNWPCPKWPANLSTQYYQPLLLAVCKSCSPDVSNIQFTTLARELQEILGSMADSPNLHRCASRGFMYIRNNMLSLHFSPKHGTLQPQSDGLFMMEEILRTTRQWTKPIVDKGLVSFSENQFSQYQNSLSVYRNQIDQPPLNKLQLTSYPYQASRMGAVEELVSQLLEKFQCYSEKSTDPTRRLMKEENWEASIRPAIALAIVASLSNNEVYCASILMDLFLNVAGWENKRLSRLILFCCYSCPTSSLLSDPLETLRWRLMNDAGLEVVNKWKENTTAVSELPEAEFHPSYYASHPEVFKETQKTFLRAMQGERGFRMMREKKRFTPFGLRLELIQPEFCCYWSDSELRSSYMASLVATALRSSIDMEDFWARATPCFEDNVPGSPGSLRWFDTHGMTPVFKSWLMHWAAADQSTTIERFLKESGLLDLLMEKIFPEIILNVKTAFDTGLIGSVDFDMLFPKERCSVLQQPLNIAMKARSEAAMRALGRPLMVEIGKKVRDSAKKSLLHKSIESQHFELACMLIKCGFDPNDTDSHGVVPLNMLLPHGEVIRSLIRAGADVFRTDQHGQNVLFRVAEKSEVPTIHIVIDAMKRETRTTVRNSADQNEDQLRNSLHSSIGRTPLHNAASSVLSCALGAMRVIMQELNLRPDVTDKYFSTPLHAAAVSDLPESIGFLLQQQELLAGHSNTGFINAKDVNGHTPLYRAAAQGAIRSIQELIRRDADLLARGKEGNTPLHAAAASKGSEAIATIFKSAGARLPDNYVHLRNHREGRTPLHLAAIADDLQTVKILLLHGADATMEDERNKKPENLAYNKEVVALLKEHCVKQEK